MAGAALVWLAAVRDLQWRLRRVAVAVGGAALVFTITLLLSGFRETFDVESFRLVADFGAAGYVVPQAANGPFSAGGLMPAAVADTLLATGQAGRADPIITGRRPITAPRRQNAYVVGHRIGGLGAPIVTEGRAVVAEREAVVDEGTGYKLGDVIDLGGVTFTVVGRVHDRTVFFGIPLVYVPIADAQQAVFSGQPLATTILTDRVVTDPPAGYRSLDEDGARADLTSILGAAVTSVTLLRLFLWCVAAAIIASVLYVSVLERARDFAVFKATGMTTRHLASAIAAQAVVLSLCAALLACALSIVIRPVFPIRLTLPADIMVSLAAVAVVIGLVAALAALRRSVRIEPAAAFRAP